MADSDPSSAGRPSGFSRLVPSRAPEDLREDPLLAFLPRDAEGRPVVGRIPILCRLGRGGMGAVYYSIHPRLNVEVAVKLLPPDLADQNPKLIERFVSEARLAVALENEHVVRVYDVDCEGKTHFLVMQYVEGESAGAFLKRRKAEGKAALEEAEALAIVTAATRGLAAAHARGIIHRDIKPDNILIPRGELAKAKLADLGLAKPEGGEASLGTMSHVAMGTPGYMAPEQAEDAKTAGAAADVFSMGATLYALLTGRAPFAGSSLAVVLRDTAMKDPAPLPGHVSAGTRAVVERCLAKDPKARFANGAALLAALEEAPTTPVTAPAAYEPTLMPMPEVKPRPGETPRMQASPLVEAERRQEAFDQAIAVGRAAEEAKELAMAKAAYEWALKLKPGDAAALAGIRGIEKNLTPGKIVLDLGGGMKMEFVLIKAGKFMMGSTGSDIEKPVHEVEITRGFWMQTTETTQAQWEVVMGSNPSYFQGADLPVECVSWEDCQEFMTRLNEKAKRHLDGKVCGLPTEAQWEYACRAGSTTTWSFGDDESKLGEYAWYDRNSDGKTHPVGRKNPNAWGLYDMHGNVREWCQDWFGAYPAERWTDPTGPGSGQYRCLRGGSLYNYAANTRSACRNFDPPTDRSKYNGLRVVLRQERGGLTGFRAPDGDADSVTFAGA